MYSRFSTMRPARTTNAMATSGAYARPAPGPHPSTCPCSMTRSPSATSASTRTANDANDPSTAASCGSRADAGCAPANAGAPGEPSTQYGVEGEAKSAEREPQSRALSAARYARITARLDSVVLVEGEGRGRGALVDGDGDRDMMMEFGLVFWVLRA
ncbi:hypothetical protein F4809DRAFT_588994 [Biscogniauxia mediterranea]|nr:hypothetical protein F4809DRAFT_588994 [Biscogniauxia mediterranea]